MSELSTISRHALTVLAGQLAVMAFGVTDTIVAGRYAQEALAALSIGSAVFISVYVGLMGVLAAHGEKLPTLKRVTSAGAPVPPDVVRRMLELLPADAQLWTPYGATECLPVAVIEGRELQETRAATEAGAGTCVGRAVSPNEVLIGSSARSTRAAAGSTRECAAGS